MQKTEAAYAIKIKILEQYGRFLERKRKFIFWTFELVLAPLFAMTVVVFYPVYKPVLKNDILWEWPTISAVLVISTLLVFILRHLDKVIAKKKLTDHSNWHIFKISSGDYEICYKDTFVQISFLPNSQLLKLKRYAEDRFRAAH